MTTRLLIARHGNTFTKDQTPTRIGRHTDLPLVEEDRGRNLGRYLKANNLIPTVIFAAPLKRTLQTAHLVVEELPTRPEIVRSDQFLEIDYGVDENKTEDEVELRLGAGLKERGKQAIEDWNTKAIVPPGWQVNPEQCVQTWIDFANQVESTYPDQTVMVVSSNGIIRFAPHITGDFDTFMATHSIKVATGNLCIFEKSVHDKHWQCKAWNIKPA